MKKIFFLCLILSAINIAGFSQNGLIFGTITEKETKDTIVCALVILKQDTMQVAQTATDMHGKYTFRSLEAGIYTIIVSCPGFQKTILKDIKFDQGERKKMEIQMVRRIPMKPTLSDIGIGNGHILWMNETTTGETIKAEQIKRMPLK